MPRKAPTPCRHPGCAALIHDGSGYCQTHARDKSGWFNNRGSAHQRGYGSRWQKLREFVLRRDGGVCQPCKAKGVLTAATAVDHIVPKSRGGSDQTDNLQAICAKCHAIKTARDARGCDCQPAPTTKLDEISATGDYF